MSKQLLNTNGEALGEITLAKEVFGVEPNLHVMHLALRRQLNNARQGSACAKTRAEVSGGGKKPWKQKVQVVQEPAHFVLRCLQVVVLYSDLNQEATKSICRKKPENWLLNQHLVQERNNLLLLRIFRQLMHLKLN